MKGHPNLKHASTQQEFAKLVGCSQSLVRAVEQEHTKITPRLAKKVQAATGVSISWLSTLHLPDKPIPAVGGGTLTHEVVIAAIQKELERNLQKVERSLMIGPKALADSSIIAEDPSLSMKRRMASTLAKLTEEALFETLSRGDNRLVNEITRILALDLPAEEPEA